jgi:tRNA-dihydrouridine synthase
VERARLYKAVNEHCFGAQIATNNIAEGVAAAQLAEEAGATWLDLNCGCPIHEATKRGLGAALLRKPTKLAKLVAGITAQVALPVTVKIRTGTWTETPQCAHQPENGKCNLCCQCAAEIAMIQMSNVVRAAIQQCEQPLSMHSSLTAHLQPVLTWMTSSIDNG